MDFLDEIIELLDSAIKEDAQNLITAWDIIKDWYNSEIDADRITIKNAHIWLDAYQKDLCKQYNISPLKIKYTKNIWYFIETSKSQHSKTPDSFIQKQSLLQVHRYTTKELMDFEQKLETASMSVSQKEYVEFCNIRNIVLWQYNNIYKLSRKMSILDFYSNWAFIAQKRRYNIPIMTQKKSLSVISWRHPVIESNSSDFISNDLELNSDSFIQVITWPNMWGKSTFLRQNALILILAHIWYYVPWQKLEIWIIDKIFSRVWSWDNLFLGQSTFMVEMQEIAYILRNATSKSFIIIDEIWRGTSTYDGMSLAWSILEYIHNEIWSKTLFATHYHEIIDHASDLKWVKNYSVAVWENEDNIVFLRKLIPGWIKKSYWIEVAKLAWIPDLVLLNARNTLKDLTQSHTAPQLSIFQNLDENSISNQKLVEYKNVSLKYSKIKDIIQSEDINTLTPLQSMQLLFELQELLKKSK